jgi:hypothetical protein
MLTARFSATRFRAVVSVPEKTEAVNVDAPARRASRYVQVGKPQTAQNNRSGTTQTATVRTGLSLITIGRISRG